MPPKSRSRKKAVSPAPAASDTPAAPAATTPGARNVGSLESALSLALGVLFVIAALFPRSLKQLFMLSLGGGLVYRGMTQHCGVYAAAGIDTTKSSLLQEINDKLAPPTGSERAEA